MGKGGEGIFGALPFVIELAHRQKKCLFFSKPRNFFNCNGLINNKTKGKRIPERALRRRGAKPFDFKPSFCNARGDLFFTHGIGEIGAHNSVPFRFALVAKQKSAAPQSKFKKNKNLSLLKSNAPNSDSR